MVRGLLTSLLIILTCTSCAYDSPLLLWSDSTTTAVFYGTVTGIDGDEVDGPGFIYGPVHLTWKGTDVLTLINFLIKLPGNGKLTDDFDCSIDGEELAALFGTATDLKVQPGQTLDGISLICTGISSINDNDRFIVNGTARIRGFSGDPTKQKIHRGEARLSLYWFPENDD